MVALNDACGLDAKPENSRWSRSDGSQLGGLDQLLYTGTSGGGPRYSVCQHRSNTLEPCGPSILAKSRIAANRLRPIGGS